MKGNIFRKYVKGNIIRKYVKEATGKTTKEKETINRDCKNPRRRMYVEICSDIAGVDSVVWGVQLTPSSLSPPPPFQPHTSTLSHKIKVVMSTTVSDYADLSYSLNMLQGEPVSLVKSQVCPGVTTAPSNTCTRPGFGDMFDMIYLQISMNDLTRRLSMFRGSKSLVIEGIPAALHSAKKVAVFMLHPRT